jgi:hypothetical protein
MNKNNDVITSKTLKNIKMNESVKREVNARLDEALLSFIDNIGLKRELK